MTKTYSIIITGATNIGKTTICKYVSDSIETPSIRKRKTTIGIDYTAFTTRGYRLNIWDTCITYLDSIAKRFYLDSDVVIAVYRPVDYHSYQCSKNVLKRPDSSDKIRIMISNRYGNDTEDTRGKQWANKKSVLFFETDVNSDTGCFHKVFQDILTELIKRNVPAFESAPTPVIQKECIYKCIKKMISKIC